MTDGTPGGWSSLRLDAWPDGDRDAWEHACAREGPLDQDGPAARLSPETLRTMRRSYGLLLAWLERRGQLEPAASVASRMTPERLGAFIMARREIVGPNTLFSEIAVLAMAFRVMAPEMRWTWMRRHPALPRRAERFAARRPVPTPTPYDVVCSLYAYLARLAAGAIDRDTAPAYRDGVLVAVALLTGLRPRNQRALALGESILRRPAGWEVLIEARGTKRHRPIACVIPDWLTPHLDHYVDAVRPTLLASKKGVSALWISQRRRRISRACHTQAFATVSALIGTTLRPHSVRHVMATELLALDPRHSILAAAALGHTDPEMVALHYDRGDAAPELKVWRRVVRRYTARAD